MPASRSLRRSCAVCDDPHRSGTPVTCARCKLVHYCSKAHRSDDATRHQVLCLSLSTLREQLRRLQRGLRGELKNYVGHYWGFYEARDFLRVKHQLVHVYRRIGTRESLEKALDEALELLRLSGADPIAVRSVVPALLLRLNRAQECYDFVKWWALALSDETYSFRDMGMPFLDLAGCDMAESTAFAEVLSLSHSLALVVVKLRVYWKLWEGIQAERIGMFKAVPVPAIQNIQDFLGYGATPLSTPIRKRQLDIHEQVMEMIKRTDELNGHVWEAVLDPKTKLMSIRTPDVFAAGSKDEVHVTLDVWLSVLLGTRGLQAAVLESGVVRMDSKTH
jgi:hypothetical protein